MNTNALESRLEAAMAARAEMGMSGTDTATELQRLRSGLAANHRRRHVQLALAATAALGIVGGSVAVGLSVAGGRAAVSVAHQPSVPAGFPIGSWAKTHGLYRETLIFSDAALVKLQDTRGMTTERLTFPAQPQEMTFVDVDGSFCTTNVSGTYRYAVKHRHLTFTLVGKDNCQSRVAYLTGSAWRFTG